MKQCLLLLLVIACAHAAPVDFLAPASCKDALDLGAAEQALNKINADRREGYIFGLHRLSNVHEMKHGENGIVFYLTLDVEETKCHVLSQKNYKDCAVRQDNETPMYGQCKATLFMNRVARVVRLYKYSCTIRPVPSSKIAEKCPDCPTETAFDDQEVLKTMKMAMEKYNKESTLTNYFVPLKVTKAANSATFYKVEFTIQETSCDSTTDLADLAKCEIMTCEFAHKGLCKATHSHGPSGEEDITVECDIFESEASEKEKQQHLLGDETDHPHDNNKTDMSLGHDHEHDHTTVHKHEHSHNEHTHKHCHDHSHEHSHAHGHDHAHDGHEEGHTHHHTHEHGQGHGHAHSHDHAHDHDHVHAHHAKAHDHSQDKGPNVHHNYGHGPDDTHEHDHELALDHEHKHQHLHEHEHHHHHHDHNHEDKRANVNVVASMDTETAVDQEVLKTMKMAMEKYNKESTLTNYFVPLKVTKADNSQSGKATIYKVEFTIQETSCDNTTDLADLAKCEIMTCEFAHKGLCKATHSHGPSGEEDITVECDIIESEASEKEKQQHLLGDETDHPHDNNKTDMSLGHDHEHDHTAVHKHEHSHNEHTHKHCHDHSHEHSHAHGHDHAHDGHEDGHTHHHTHEHGQGHGHAHSHDHAHDHDHVHAHHAKAHDHSQDKGPNVHHNYGHGPDDTHEHDHELALDHEHKHQHLHEHEHHHHHHDHNHEDKRANVNVVASMDTETAVDQEVLKTMKMAMEKYNKESTLTNYFVPLKVTKTANSQSGKATIYKVEFTIQETSCDNTTDLADLAKCEIMTCEFAHKGLCKATHSHGPSGEEDITVECDIIESEASEKEKQQHLLGDETDHPHDNNKTDMSLGHDHEHDHTAVHKHEHSHNEHTHKHCHDHSHEHSHAHGHDHAHDGHEEGHTHHHTHEHGQGHGHAHSHDHAHDHDHVHAHHAKAHDHSQDKGPNVHHNYGHGPEDTHEHDHELALDHEHKHQHLHEHEHHHHHHDHNHEDKIANVNVVASMDTETAVDQEVLKTMKMAMEKYNKESTLTNYFVPLKVTKAANSQSGKATIYKVEFTIQETSCDNTTDLADLAKCEIMTCEFAHKGLCKATHSHGPSGEEDITVECDIIESEASEKEKQQHLLGDETDHPHDNNKTDMSLGHDHEHDHTTVHKHEHSHNEHTHDHCHDHSHEHSHAHGHDHAHDGHEEGHTHHHTHEHGQGHGHAHSHDHAHDHDHVHAHHAKAHDHSQDKGPNVHHNYGHGPEDTHEHDHELALDHEHKHQHLHEHEHHHHHHNHNHEDETARHPDGFVKVVASMDKSSFPVQPVADGEKPTTLELRPDPEIPGEREPVIKPFPATLSAECPIVAPELPTLVDEMFAKDPLFKIAA